MEKPRFVKDNMHITHERTYEHNTDEGIYFTYYPEWNKGFIRKGSPYGLDLLIIDMDKPFTLPVSERGKGMEHAAVYLAGIHWEQYKKDNKELYI